MGAEAVLARPQTAKNRPSKAAGCAEDAILAKHARLDILPAVEPHDERNDAAIVRPPTGNSKLI